MAETWTSIRNIRGTETATVSGRTPVPWYKKVNPIWWFGNQDQPYPPDDYMPGSWFRLPAWYLRNPLVNFSDYVVGVCDRNYTCFGTAPVRVTAWNDLPPPWKTGFKWSVIDLGWLKLPFVSYTGRYVMWYAGWQVSGNLGFKINILNSPMQAY